MEHEEIRLKLAAYLDNAVSVEEKEEIRKHLGICGGCRGEIADLELTVRYLKSLPEVDPPSWLVDRIMANVRNEDFQKTSLCRRIFSPLHIKLPFEVLAVLFLCMAGYYLTRMINEENLPAVRPSVSPKLTKGHPSTHGKTEIQGNPARPGTQIFMPRRNIDYLPPKTESETPVSASLPTPSTQEPASTLHKSTKGKKLVEPELQPADNGFMTERETRFNAGEEKTSGVSKGGKKGQSVEVDRGSGGGVTQPARNGDIFLVVDDPAAVSDSIEETVTRSGGRITGHSYSGDTNILFVRIGADKVTRVVNQLGHIGTVKEHPQPSPDAGGMIDLIIRW